MLQIFNSFKLNFKWWKFTPIVSAEVFRQIKDFEFPARER